MKFRVLSAGLVAAGCLLAPQQAQALTATTTYQYFKIYQNPAFNNPATLNFQNFNAALPGTSGNLTGLGFKIAGNRDGTGSATVGGNPRVGNGSEDADSQAFISYAPKFTFQATSPLVTSSPITGTTTAASPNPVACVSTQSCPTPGGGTTIPLSSFRTLNLTGSYNGSGGFASISGPAWRTGTVTSTTASANFSGTGSPVSIGFNFDPIVGSPPSVVSKPYIEGYVALVYEYNLPPVPGAAVPGPLPLLGAASAFAWSRRMRNRIASVV